MRIIEEKVYTFDEHPDKEKCLEWVRTHWHYLADHYVDDMAGSLKALAEHFGCKVDWAVSVVPDRGEYVRFIDVPETTINDMMASGALTSAMLEGNCPLTGMCYDENILDAFRDALGTPHMELRDVLHQAGENALSALHVDGEYAYSDESLAEMLTSNGYEFNENGEVV